jgi:hypothetical protein
MSRYVINIRNKQPLAFDELILAKRHAHTLARGSVVVITDLKARAGEPIAYIITAGEAGVVERLPVRTHPLR